MRPLVCALVLNYNGKELAEKMVSSFSKTTYPNYRLVVVDNGSNDDSVKFLRKKFPKLEIFAISPNRGFAGGNNRGAEYVVKKYDPDYILLLNNDMEVVQPEWLDELVKVAESDNKIGIVGCKLIFADGRIQHAGAYFHPVRITFHRGLLEEDKGQYDKTEDVDYVTGACFLIRRDVIKKIGLLNEQYSPYYFEESDYCNLARKEGYRIVYAGKAKLIHYTSVTTGKDMNEKKYYIWEKNRMRFVLKNFSFFWRVTALARILAGAVFSFSPVKRLKILIEAYRSL